ncbi:MAG: hypothetical protein ACYDH9_18150 [Limisphaerales bacterium]
MNLRSRLNEAAVCRPAPGRLAATARAREAAFTMVEIALCLAIIGFALVAIIGVLPTGLQVQRDNNQDTIINQEGSYFLEAIRSGSQGVDELAQYVDAIRSYTNGLAAPAYNFPSPKFLNGSMIVGLLSRPNSTNVAKVRGITGSAADKSRVLTNFTFSYLLTTQVIPLTNAFPLAAVLSDPYVRAQAQSLSANAYELRLRLQWPLLPDGPNGQWRAGDNSKVFRTLVSGQLTNANPFAKMQFFFQPSTFVP